MKIFFASYCIKTESHCSGHVKYNGVTHKRGKSYPYRIALVVALYLSLMYQLVGNVDLLAHPHLSLPPLFDGVAVYVLRMDCSRDDVVELTHSLC